MTNGELKKILENHQHWLNEDVDNWRELRAYLRDADLEGADLRDADLRGADLKDAYLKDADLRDANFRDADLRDAKNVPFIPMACPDEGGFIGWKKALVIDRGPSIIKLYIPADAKRSSATGRKCRCNKAKVLSITHILSGKSYDVANSTYDKRFVYKVGEYVEVDNFDEDRFNECAPGIHFFINKQEAIDY